MIFASVATLGRNEYLSEEFFSPDYFDYLVIDDKRVIIRTKLEKPSKIKGLVLIHHFTTIINSAPFAEQGILRLS